MARKVFQDFAHVLCQKFIQTPSNVDLVNLAILGDGRLELDISTQTATHNRYAISPLPCMKEAREWLESRVTALRVPSEELLGAMLAVDYTVILQRRPDLNWLTAQYDFSCVGTIRARDREYTSSIKAAMEWGLSQLL